MLRPDLNLGAAFTVSEVPNLRAKLDQNEAGRDLPAELKERLLDEVKRLSWNRYPQPKAYYEVKEPFAEALGLSPDQVFLTVGCDQVIIYSFVLFAGPGRPALVPEPTYPMYRLWAKLSGTPTEAPVLGPRFQVSPELWRGKGFKLICLVSPNNPTGNLVPEEVVEDALGTGAAVLVDEAYYNFSKKTYLPLLKKYPNLVIGRSLAKGGLAGLRLGYGIARSEITRAFEDALVIPYHLNYLQLALAKLIGEFLPYMEEVVQEVLSEKAKLYKLFDELGIEYLRTETNFVPFKLPEPRRVYEALLAEGVRVRDISKLPGMEGWLRVTVGAPAENEAFADALRKAL